VAINSLGLAAVAGAVTVDDGDDDDDDDEAVDCRSVSNDTYPLKLPTVIT